MKKLLSVALAVVALSSVTGCAGMRAAAGLTLETEWKVTSNGNSMNSSRYLFQGSAPQAGSCQVSATRAMKSQQGSTSMSRDWQMEWDLLKQVDMEAAQRIEVDATAAGEVARNTKS